MSLSSPNGNDLLMTSYQPRGGTLYLVFSRFYGFARMTCLLHVHHITVSLYYLEHGKETDHLSQSRPSYAPSLETCISACWTFCFRLASATALYYSVRLREASISNLIVSLCPRG